ncbi:SGNH/GDSL hydrolase family protein [Endozoicomonas arenosclerae]|uniref:SGNH/GDSL hydrolase family protein n=1 Tax=Endozoicomonas arenosclerae TaxID=1633495 RepID=UPI00078440BF|nr:SGNH/GDSL hydrolase family protein [Endozoicomonas arenosclerae]
MSMFKRLAVLAMFAIPVGGHAVPIGFSKDTNPVEAVKDFIHEQEPSRKVLSGQTFLPEKVIIFGDSLSEIGNTQLLLKTLAGEETPGVIFKPLNKNEKFQKLLSYLNLSISAVENLEDKIARFFIRIIDFFVDIPVYPDHYYYNGPDGKGFGRFSNGPNWSEWLGYMILGNQVQLPEVYVNRAYGGSWASRLGQQKIDWTWNLRKLKASIVEFVNGKLLPPNMHSIVSAYIDLEHPASEGGELIAVFYGANDYMNNDYLAKPGKFPPRITPESTVNDINHELVRLADWASKAPQGAPESFIYIANLPRMSIAPRYRSGGKKGQGKYVDADVLEHNRLLKAAFDKLVANPAYHGKVNFRFVDTFSIFERLYAGSTVSNKVDACYPNDMLSSALLMENIHQKSTVKPCASDKQDDYFFWDVVHPTRVVYASLASEICKIVNADIQASCFTPSPDDNAAYPRPAFNP